MSKQILVERKDTNLANKLETQHKIPKEYTTFRDSLIETLSKQNEINCNAFVPQLYNILLQAGLEPREARAVVLKDGTELFHWSPITIDKAIKDPRSKNEVKAKAGRISASVKKQKKLVESAVHEAAHRGPGRPRNPESVFSTIVDIDEFRGQFESLVESAKKSGTNKMRIEVSESGKLTLTVVIGSGTPKVAA